MWSPGLVLSYIVLLVRARYSHIYYINYNESLTDILCCFGSWIFNVRNYQRFVAPMSETRSQKNKHTWIVLPASKDVLFESMVEWPCVGHCSDQGQKGFEARRNPCFHNRPYVTRSEKKDLGSKSENLHGERLKKSVSL